jgi:hypothetical protein
MNGEKSVGYSPMIGPVEKVFEVALKLGAIVALVETIGEANPVFWVTEAAVDVIFTLQAV